MATTLPPPQAYTRDILAAAYEWLRSQPQSIRELANNSDNLVALYMQARRRGGSPMLPPLTEASSETFKQDLRALAEGMKQFEHPPHATGAHAANANSNSTHLNPPTAHAATVTTAVQPQPALQAHASTPANVSSNMPATTLNMPIDPRTFEILRNTQNLCNLGSEREALRMLIAIGFERLRDLFPR